ncbi:MULTISPECIES: DUF3558 domain-containing protein [Streptomyces]|uniref:DUF3558 domain-containing protein n=1 Tax=Streptomyces TaxID=1883 RepID=UPI00081D35BA|nr:MULTISPECIES: DUF3558 domain-containing protein [unclassified Streptomyces]SCF87238.1 hypothetical protein GA0115258_11522 [Streptomyces sp. LamerLS-31b]SCF92229.1 hypothetical protein GA0115256_133316 [Streptomyces sp. DconLS]
MQRAKRDDRDRLEQRNRRLRRALVCAAAVPAVLITAACSSDSGDSKPKSDGTSASKPAGDSASPSASSSPTVAPATYKTLPDACKALSKKTLGDMVPKADSSGKKGSSDEPSSRASCSWSSLSNNGVKGSQFRWLNVSLLRFDSDTTRGSGNAQAHTYFTNQVKDAQSVGGAKNAKVVPVSGTGDEATSVRYDLSKKEGLFKQETLVARAENVVVTLDYNGAGLAGDKTPDPEDLAKSAEKALKEAVASVSAANSGSGSGGSSAGSSTKPSGSASASAGSKKS